MVCNLTDAEPLAIHKRSCIRRMYQRRELRNTRFKFNNLDYEVATNPRPTRRLCVLKGGCQRVMGDCVMGDG